MRFIALPCLALYLTWLVGGSAFALTQVGALKRHYAQEDACYLAAIQGTAAAVAACEGPL